MTDLRAGGLRTRSITGITVRLASARVRNLGTGTGYGLERTFDRSSPADTRSAGEAILGPKPSPLPCDGRA